MRQAPLRHAPGTFPCLVPKGSAKLAKNTACPAISSPKAMKKWGKAGNPNLSSGFPMLRNRNFKVFYVNPLAFRIKSIVLCPSKRVYPLRAFLLKINQ